MHGVSVAHNFACTVFQWLITILTACTVFQWLVTILAWLHAWLMDILTVAIYHTCCNHQFLYCKQKSSQITDPSY